MRIVSLVPSATEMLFALGAGDEVIAVTHECDYPPEAAELPHVTRSVIPEGLSEAEIDGAVRERLDGGEAIYELDEELVAELEPDLIVTQSLCSVCAVSYDEVRAVATRVETQPRVVSLDSKTLGEVLGDVGTLARATGREEAGAALVARAAERIDAVRMAVDEVEERPRVAALEWLDPVFSAGHWTPQLIAYAGGEDVLGLPGEPSAERSWEEVAAAEPDLVAVMLCGFDAARCWEEALDRRGRLEPLGAPVVAVDAAAYFSRPGPRLVDGLELLAHLLHPDRVPPAAADALPVPF